MKIKVCGNTSQENLDSLLQLSPEFVGFIFYSASKRFVKPDKTFRSFVSRIKSAQKVGVFVNASTNEVASHVEAFKLDFVQLHGGETPELCANISRLAPVIKAFRINQDFEFASVEAYQSSCSYFLFDNVSSSYGGSGSTFDWSLLNKYERDTPFLLSGGIGPDHVHHIKTLTHNSLFGIDLNSRFESSLGLKDASLLKTFFHEIRN